MSMEKWEVWYPNAADRKEWGWSIKLYNSNR